MNVSRSSPAAAAVSDHPADLRGLWEHVEALNRRLAPGSSLPPVMGGGQMCAPSLACVFINPTYRNTSTRDGWDGPRFPFIGTKAVWRVFARAGLFPMNLLAEIESRSHWDSEFAAYVYSAVERRGLYLTNLIKWTGENGDLPPAHFLDEYREVLQRELAIIRPRAVVAFGAFTFKALTGKTVPLGQIRAEARATGVVRATPMESGARRDLPLYPCYFPVGRGNPKGAVEILKAIAAATDAGTPSRRPDGSGVSAGGGS